MNVLTIRIEENWPEIPIAEWILTSHKNTVLQEGKSEPSHWPIADQTIAVLAGAQISLTRIKLPKSRRDSRDKLITYALEESLPIDTETQHFTLLEQSGDQAIVALIDRVRLKRLVDSFNSVSRPLQAVYGRLQSLPHREGTAVCCVELGMRYWRWPDGSGFAEDIGNLSDPDGSWIAQKSIQSFQVRSMIGPPEIAKVFSVPLDEKTKPESLLWHHASGSRNLLHGQFEPKESARKRWQYFKWPVVTAAFAGALHLVASMFSVLQLRDVEQQLNLKIKSVFESNFPGAALVDPALQMRRHLNQLRPQYGQLRDDDMLVLLSLLSDGLGTDGPSSITKMRYEAGALEVSLGTKLTSNNQEPLVALLAMRGIEVRSTTSTSETTLSLRRATQ